MGGRTFQHALQANRHDESSRLRVLADDSPQPTGDEEISSRLNPVARAIDNYSAERENWRFYFLNTSTPRPEVQETPLARVSRRLKPQLNFRCGLFVFPDSLKSLRRSRAFRSAIRASGGASGCPLLGITDKGRRSPWVGNFSDRSVGGSLRDLGPEQTRCSTERNTKFRITWLKRTQ